MSEKHNVTYPVDGLFNRVLSQVRLDLHLATVALNLKEVRCIAQASHCVAQVVLERYICRQC